MCEISLKIARVEIEVNPNKVSAMVVSKDVKNFKITGMSFNENFLIQQIKKGFMHPTIYSIYIQKRPYKSTVQYKKMKNAVQLYLDRKITNPSDHGAYWCKSLEDIDKYFANLDKTFSSIKNFGYKTQKQLKLENKNIVKGRGYDELKFLMGSDGSIVFFGSGGNHRFSICRLLKVKKVKGFLIGIHEDNLKRINTTGCSYNDYLNKLKGE